VALVQGGREIIELALDLGVSVWSLRYWVKRAQAGALSESKTLAQETPAERELRRLRHTLAFLGMCTEIFGKTNMMKQIQKDITWNWPCSL
jgi:transposase-like protein